MLAVKCRSVAIWQSDDLTYCGRGNKRHS